MLAEEALRWVEGEFINYDSAAHEGDPLVADSFHLEDGRAVRLDLHRDRFLDSCAAMGLNVEELDDGARFWKDAIFRLPRSGSWFPRIQVQRAGTGLQWTLLIRPAPGLTSTIRILSHLGADPRTVPAIKGPDLSALHRLRSGLGPDRTDTDRIDDLVLLTNDLQVIESTTCAIVWWEDSVLCVPPSEPAEFSRIRSVTEAAVLELAQLTGARVRESKSLPDDLRGREVWLLNSLHGIRQVEVWLDARVGEIEVQPEPGRFETWQQNYRSLQAAIGVPDK